MHLCGYILSFVLVLSFLRLEVDLLSESCVKLNLQLLHLLAHSAYFIFQRARLVVYPCRSRLKHLLRLL